MAITQKHRLIAVSTPLGEDVLVVGAGPIGLMATAVVRHAGARAPAVTDTGRQEAVHRPVALNAQRC